MSGRVLEPSAPGARGLGRLGDREAEREERLARAHERAAVLLRTVAPLKNHQAMLGVASLLIRHLRVERCDILQFAAKGRAVIIGAAIGAEDMVSDNGRAAGSTPDPPDASRVRFDLVHILDSRAAIAALRVAGTHDRIHVFIHSPCRGTQLGVLSLQGAASLNLSANERALVDAIAHAIGAALDRGKLPTGEDLVREHAKRRRAK